MEAQTNTMPQHAAYIHTTLLTLLFCVPSFSGSPWHYAFTFFFLLLFIFYNAWSYQREQPALLKSLSKNAPLASYLLLGFIISSAISLLLVWINAESSGQKLAQSIKYFYYTLMLLFCFSLAWFISFYQLNTAKLWLAFSLGLWPLLLQFLLIYHVFDAPNFARWAADPPIGGNLRLVGMAISIAFCTLCIHIVFKQLSRPKLAFFLISLFSFLIMLSWSGSRSSILLCGFMIVLLYFAKAYQSNLFSPLAQFSGLALLFLAALIIGHNLPLPNGGGLGRFAGFLSFGDSASSSEDYLKNLSAGRVALWFAAIDAIKQSPWFGLGPFGYFFFSMHQGEHTDHVHNIFLQFFVEWGIIGALLLIALITHLLFTFVRKAPAAIKRNDVEFLTAFSILIMLTLNGLTDGTYSALLPVFLVTSGYAYLLKTAFEQVLTNQTRKTVAQNAS